MRYGGRRCTQQKLQRGLAVQWRAELLHASTGIKPAAAAAWRRGRGGTERYNSPGGQSGQSRRIYGMYDVLPSLLQALHPLSSLPLAEWSGGTRPASRVAVSARQPGPA